MERVPFTVREEALAAKTGLSLQTAMHITSLEDSCRLGLTSNNKVLAEKCRGILTIIEAL